MRDLECDEVWDSKSGRQARSTVGLFELLVGRKPFATYTQADFSAFKRKIRCLPKRYDMTSASSRVDVLATVAARENNDNFEAKNNEQALSSRTRNRHLSSLKGVHRWAKKNGLAVPDIDFESLFIAVSKARRGRNLRPATPKDDVKALFDLPVFTGCQPHRGGTGQRVLRARFTPDPTPLEKLIGTGESEKLEFKQTLRWDVRQQLVNKKLEEVIVKTVTAFANSSGGTLLIGVCDDGTVTGIEDDMRTLGGPIDRLELHLSNLFNSHFPTAFWTARVKVGFPTVSGTRICRVDVDASRAPLYVKISDKAGAIAERLFVRSGNSSHEMPPSQIASYERERFSHQK